MSAITAAGRQWLFCFPTGDPGFTPLDPITVGGAATLILSLGLIVRVLPALRAGGIDLASVLKDQRLNQRAGSADKRGPVPPHSLKQAHA
jgi:hypothetical protein